jgi:enoyl-[acyl-carrier protein] reductase I
VPFGAGRWAQYIATDPVGKFVYVANAGTSYVSAHEIEATGALKPVKGSPFAAGNETCTDSSRLVPSSRHVSPNAAAKYQVRGCVRGKARCMSLLEGKTALITGVANRWSIATGIARAFHAHGARLAFIYQGERVKDEVEKLAAELGGGKAYACDVSSDEALAGLAQDVARDYGRIDALVHSIAFVNKEDLAGKVFKTSRGGFSLALDISSYSLIGLTNALLEVFNDGASIMALTYFGSTAIVPNYNVAGISKAALESIVRYLAYDLGDRGIRVNAISAGPISTASSRQVKDFKKMLDKVEAAAPLRRNITSEDVGNTAVYLASDLARAITADIHFVDAGYHAMGMYPEMPKA